MDTAERAKISVTRYWKIENGYIEPSSGERTALARVFKVDQAEAFPEVVSR